MSLEKYNKKRNFLKTKEPKGEVEKSKKSNLIFVIQYHRATQNHYDFRLQYDGTLLSFAVPKGLSNTTKNLAVMVEDHPIEYANFEGVIEKGEYGGGSVLIFDKGIYAPLCNFKQGLKEGKLKFELFGEKYSGIFNLIRLEGNNFIIFKDKSLKKEKKVNNEIEDILKAKRTKNSLKNLSCELATLVQTVPSERTWIYEIKYDGYRILSCVENGRVELLSRNGLDFNKKFPNIVEYLEKNIKENVILDGEIVCFDSFGRTDFGLLQNNIKQGKSNFCYVVFDILAYNGRDLRNLRLIERKFILNEIVKKLDKPLIYSEFLSENGEKLFKFAKRNKLEGIMCKDKNSQYIGKRTKDWLKVKRYKRQEFVILGYLTSEKNKKFSAILVGVYENGEFIFVGKVGTGFKESEKDELLGKFNKLVVKKCPFKNIDHKFKSVVYLKPKLVAEVQFAELTKSRVLRQASFIAIRQDKAPKGVKFEY